MNRSSEIVLFHAAADLGAAAQIAAHLEFLAEAQVRLEVFCDGDSVEDVWAQGEDAPAILLLLSPSSVPSAATREKWPSILRHRESSALPPIGLISIAPCKCPPILERKHFFRYADNPRRALRELAYWVSNLAERTKTHFSPARQSWFAGRGVELEQLWESLVDEAGVTILASAAAASGKSTLAQEFVRVASRHFRDVLWIECGTRTEISIAGELAARLGVSLGNHGEDAFARIGTRIQERRVLLVLDDAAEGLPISTAGGGRASVLVTTRSEAVSLLPGATVIPVEPIPLPAMDASTLHPAAHELLRSLQICRPLALATRIARLEEAEAQEACRILVEARWIDPMDAAGLCYRLGAGAVEPVGEEYRRRHAEALAESFSKWGTQPGSCRTLLAEMDTAFAWALRSNWKLAIRLGHCAAGFLNQEGRLAEAIYIYRQLLTAAQEQNDPDEIENCMQQLSWVDEQEGNRHRTLRNTEQTTFNFSD